MSIKQTILRLFFTTFLLFSLQMNNLIANVSEEKIPTHIAMTEQEKEIVHDLLSQAREHTEAIGYYMQYLQQVLQMGTISCTPEKKQEALAHLQDTKELIHNLGKMLVHANPSLVTQGFIINNIIISYLLPTIQKDVLSINAETLQNNIQEKLKTTFKSFSDQKFEALVEANTKNLEILKTITSEVHLNPLQKTYRRYSGSVLKAGGLVAAAAFLTCFALACSDKMVPETLSTSDSWFADKFKKHISDVTVSLKKDGVFRNTLGEVVSSSDLPFFQNLSYSINKLHVAGLAAVGALATLLPQYKNSINTAKQYDATQLKVMDKYLTKHTDITMNLSSNDICDLDDITNAEYFEKLAETITATMKNSYGYGKGILLFGPPQTGKTMFAAALKHMVEESFEKGKKVQFINANDYLNEGASIDQVFRIAQFYAPAIIFFDEIDTNGTHRLKDPKATKQLLTCMTDIKGKQIIVIGATNRPDQLDSALLYDPYFKHLYICS